MLSQKIFSARVFLGTLAGKVDMETWEGIRQLQAVLYDAEAQAKKLESTPLCLAAENGLMGQLAIAACTFAE